MSEVRTPDVVLEVPLGVAVIGEEPAEEDEEDVGR